MDRIFILSPARTDGKRTAMVINPQATFELARRVRGEGAPLGEVFAFLSGLYFRGKLTYARRFGQPPQGVERCYVITSNAGLVSADEPVTIETLTGYASVPIDPADARYAGPLDESIARLRERVNRPCEVVLLGSIATGKYIGPLEAQFGELLLFPKDFVGRGDMSRGGLLLRAVASGTELEYLPVTKAERLKGSRPPKLEPLPRGEIAERKPGG